MCTTSGWNCTPKIPRSASSRAATGTSAVVAVTVKPSGATVMESKWLIHTCWCLGWAGPKSRPSTLDVQVGAPVLAPAGVGHLAAELQGDELGAVADAQDGDAEVVDRGVEAGRPFDVDRLRPAGEDQAGRGPLGHLGRGDRVGDDLAVDVGLADPPGDELGVLRAEVDDQDVVRASPMGTQCPIPTPWDFCRPLPSVCSAGATMTSAFWNSLRLS